MAKSGRSKTQRANRRFKRIRYGAKEAAKLKQIVELEKKSSGGQPLKEIYKIPGKETEVDTMETDMKEVEANTEKNETPEEPNSDVHGALIEAQKTSGAYPAWMNQRAIQKAKAARKKRQRGVSKKKAQSRRPWKN